MPFRIQVLGLGPLILLPALDTCVREKLGVSGGAEETSHLGLVTLRRVLEDLLGCAPGLTTWG